jgi:hypothetical protein
MFVYTLKRARKCPELYSLGINCDPGFINSLAKNDLISGKIKRKNQAKIFFEVDLKWNLNEHFIFSK